MKNYYMKKKALSPIVSVTLLLIVTVISTVSFQVWLSSYENSLFSQASSSSSIEKFNIKIEGIYDNELYFNTGGSLNISKIEIEGIDCSISGYYTDLSSVNISNCLDNITTKYPKVNIFTSNEVITSTVSLREISFNSNSITSFTDSNCFNSSNINTTGSWEGCDGMLIVNKTMLDYAVDNNPINSGEDFFLNYGGINYTFGDSQYNIFTGQVTSLSNLFQSEINFNSNINYWDTRNVTQMFYTFAGATSFNQPLNNWNTSKVIYLTDTFSGATSFNQSINTWDTSQVINMDYLFFGATNFNQPLNNWNTSKVLYMNNVFRGATSFNQPLNLWDVKNVSGFNQFLNDATSFNSSLANWSFKPGVSLYYFFRGASSFNQDISSWNVSGVSDFDSLFRDAISFNQDISSWNVSNVTNMNSLLRGATLFNQNLSLWDVDQVTQYFTYDSGASSWVAGNKPSFS